MINTIDNTGIIYYVEEVSDVWSTDVRNIEKP